jgi:hypothetical protein
MLNGEIWGYETFADNGDGTYDLQNARRALLDTAPVDGAVDDLLYFFDVEGFWDEAVPASPFTAYMVDRAPSGRSTEAGATKVALTPVERHALPAPPDFLQLEATRDIDQVAEAGTSIEFTWRERNRMSASIAFESDATETAESGTTYNLEICKASDGTVLQVELAIAATSVALALDSGLAPCAAIAKLWAVRDGKTSFAPALFPFTLITADTLTIDDDPVTIDGETVEFD